MKAKPKLNFFELPVPTADGDFLAHYSETGLAGVDFPGAAKWKQNNTSPVPRQIQAWHRITSKALTDVLAGRQPQQLPPLDLSTGTDFQRTVWLALKNIACGQTRSYSEIARTIGRPRAVRAVGGACGANPIPVLVPCHRVLAAHSRLGGFSGGLNWKRTLLAREGISFS